MKIKLDLSAEEMQDVIYALKKQEGRKPQWQYHGSAKWAHCTSCGNRLMDGQRFCNACGQKVEWEDDERTD